MFIHRALCMTDISISGIITNLNLQCVINDVLKIILYSAVDHILYSCDHNSNKQ